MQSLKFGWLPVSSIERSGNRGERFADIAHGFCTSRYSIEAPAKCKVTMCQPQVHKAGWACGDKWLPNEQGTQSCLKGLVVVAEIWGFTQYREPSERHAGQIAQTELRRIDIAICSLQQ